MDREKETIDTWDQLAEMYQDKFMDLDLYDDGYELFCNLIKKRHAAIFEIGCGPGNITRYLLQKRPDFIMEATDSSPSMINLAKHNNPSADCKVLDARDISTVTNKFDGIMCGFCMPYLSKKDCIKLIGDCVRLLNNNGILYFSTIEDDYSSSKYETSSNGQFKVFVYYHQEDYLRGSLQQNNFEIVDLERKKFTKADGSVSTHMIFIAKKN